MMNDECGMMNEERGASRFADLQFADLPIR
jgi:hypothetical protein